MKKTSPKKAHAECVWWEVVGISLLVFIAVYTIVVHVPGFSANKEVIVTIGASFSILWCIWIVRTFRDIMSWWTELQDSINQASELLHEAKQDIKEIKSINHELSSR